MSLLLPRRRCFLNRTAAAAGGGGGSSLLLDDGDVPSCDLAISFDRKLRDAYTGGPFRLRRSSDSAETDATFSNNRVAVGPLESHLGMDDGFLPRFYDQTANGRNVVQTTAAAQPQAGSSGAILVDAGGRYYGSFDGVNHVMSAATWSLVQPCTVVMVLHLVTHANLKTLFDGSTTNTMRLYMTSTGAQYRMLSTSGTTNLTGPAAASKGLVIAEWNGASSKFYLNNGTAQASSTTGSGSPGGLTVGARTTLPNDPAEFNLYELLVFPSVLGAAALAAIRTNINAHYSIW